MRFSWGCYSSEFAIPGLGAKFFVHKPFYLLTIKHPDGSYKQCGTHKSLELRMLVGYWICYIEIDYKHLILPKQFPSPIGRRKHQV